ncbi:MAG: DUF368 domain-containing protein [Candidatus Acetothermia bacterium]
MKIAVDARRVLRVINRHLILFLKGMVMGFADVIPGVSGGTMALITGIYEELVRSIKSLDLRIIPELLRGDFRGAKSRLAHVNFRFLIPLALGIGVALFAGSQFVRYLLNNFPPHTYSFFFGLIIASAVLVYLEIPRLGPSVFVASVFGGAAAVLLVGLSQAAFDHGLAFIALSGAIAVCAMILPGISGAFLLLLLGQYEYILDAVANLPGSYYILIVFGLGAAIGLALFSRVLSYALERWRSVTLGLLVGLMVGALRKPVEVLLYSSSDASITFTWNLQSTLAVVGLGLAGVLTVVGLGLFRRREVESEGMVE